MHPLLTWLDIGPRQVPIASYGVCMCLAIAIAAAGVLYAGQKARCDAGACIALIGMALGAGFAGALLLHGVVQWVRSSSLHSALLQPGLASFGAALGVAAALRWGARGLGLRALELSDRALPALALGQAVGRVGCLLGGCCYGRPWDGLFALSYALPGEAAVSRHPVPLYESVALLAAALFWAWVPDRAPGSGRRTRAAVIGYCVLRLVLESLRADAVRGELLPGALSIAQIIASAVLALALLSRWGNAGLRAARPILSLAAVLLLGVAARADAPAFRQLNFAPLSRVLVGAGWLQMGSDEADIAFAVELCQQLDPGADCTAARFADEQPRHRVYVPGFKLERTEVSRAEYASCVQASVCAPAVSTEAVRVPPDLPVTGVTATQAEAYCSWRRGRLPSEAEWERAARGSDTRRFPWGNLWNSRRASHGGPSVREHLPRLAPVASFADGASPTGALQLAGNVWEITADAYDPTAYARSERIDPHPNRGAGGERAIRGGSWRSPGYGLRVTQRAGIKPNQGRGDVGFRCAYDL